MTATIAAILLAAGQDIVIEMNDGVREVQSGRTGVRVEVRNHGRGGPVEALPQKPGVKTGTKRMFDEGGHAKAWL